MYVLVQRTHFIDDPIGHGQTFMMDFFGVAFSC